MSELAIQGKNDFLPMPRVLKRSNRTNDQRRFSPAMHFIAMGLVLAANTITMSVSEQTPTITAEEFAMSYQTIVE